MYKILLLGMMSAVWVTLYGLQVDQELAMHMLFQGKHALNRATHAGAQQIDTEKLARGIVSIDPIQAKSEAMRYLRENLRLDPANGIPLPGAYLKHPVELVEWLIVNEHDSFPYTYRNETYNYEVTLQRPGVIMIIRIAYPRIYTVLEPIEWYIKSAAELVY